MTDAMSSHPYRLSGPLNPTQGNHSPDTRYSILSLSGLGSRRSGACCGFSGSGAGSGTDFTRRPHLYLITRTRYLRAETWNPKEIVRS